MKTTINKQSRITVACNIDSYFPIWTSMKGFLRLSFKKLVRIYVCSLIISVVTRKQKERSIKVSSHFLESWFLKGPKTNPASRLCPLCAENQMPKICSKSSTISSSYFKEGRNWKGREDGGCCCGGETRSGFALQQKNEDDLKTFSYSLSSEHKI